jgi:hypothetical protein
VITLSPARPHVLQEERMALRTVLVPIFAAWCALACSAANDRALGTETGGSAGTGTGGGPGSGGSGAIGIDGGGTSGDAAPPEECENVDILFVIDSSGSMGDNQQSLINSFAGFVTAIKDKLQYAKSYHVGVVTTDDYYYNKAGCQKIGSLVTQTGGPESSSSVCGPYSSGKPYMDETEPDLAGKFACAAKVGAGGSDDERVARALLDATNPGNNAPGACNDGFSRPDSLLVIVIVTDEDDVPDVCNGDPTPCGCQTCGSGGDSAAWYDELVSHKQGIPQNIVVLSLLGMSAANTCGAQIASKLIGFTNKFGDNGYKGDVCATSYDGFFTDVLPVLDTACQNYVPPPIH